MVGVDRCVVGYCGGTTLNPTYETLGDYTEACLVEYNPAVHSFTDILAKWKTFGSPYPTATQYKWAVFYLNEEQRIQAEEFRSTMPQAEYVDVVPVTEFYQAEERHQNFLQRMGM